MTLSIANNSSLYMYYSRGDRGWLSHFLYFYIFCSPLYATLTINFTNSNYNTLGCLMHVITVILSTRNDQQAEQKITVTCDNQPHGRDGCQMSCGW